MACNACRFFSKSRIYQIAARRKSAIGDGVSWTTPCKRGEAERSLEIAKPRAKSLGEGRLWQVTTGRDMPPLIHTMRHFLRQAQFFFGEADFFPAKRLFLRAARDVSGVRSAPPWARVVIKLKTSFQALSHSPSHERASALTSPPPDFLFISIPQCPHPHQIPHPSTRLNLFNLLGLLGLLGL